MRDLTTKVNVDILAATETFMRAAGQPIPQLPAIPPHQTLTLRLKLILEEVEELVQACGFADLEEAVVSLSDGELSADVVLRLLEKRVSLPLMMDAFADIIVIAQGGALETAGSKAAYRVHTEVALSNLEKIGPDGKCKKREDGKILKPESWSEPDVLGALYPSAKR